MRVRRYGNKKLAQSATELAIFGAILMFVIGLIVRQGLNQSQQTNIRLRAMRMALDESYRTGEGQYDKSQNGRLNPSPARNTASILVIEDRLSADMADKYLTRERAPFVAAASASFSRNLFMPIDWDDEQHLPVYDVFINGQRFPFSLAAFRTVTIDESHPFWEPSCVNLRTPNDPDIRGCAIFYKQIYNFPNSAVPWCSGTDAQGNEEECPENMLVDDRFDLDRNGVLDDYEPQVDDKVWCYNVDRDWIQCPLRELFGWQWIKIPGVQNSIKGKIILDGAGNPRKYKGVDVDKHTNLNVDVDGDGFDEEIYHVHATEGIITSVDVRDDQAGDLDFSGDGVNDRGHKAGLRDDVLMYSFTKDGTLLQIREGKLYNNDGQFVRHTNRQEHADIVMRIFDVSNDTHRFCENGQPVDWSSTPGLMGLKNPVEACSDCFTTNIERTCMMPDEKVIFIRSRIQDLRGNRWVTRFNEE